MAYSHRCPVVRDRRSQPLASDRLIFATGAADLGTTCGRCRIRRTTPARRVVFLSLNAKEAPDRSERKDGKGRENSKGRQREKAKCGKKQPETGRNQPQ
jgi:hypothetical protein